ncbi:MAG: 6-phosphogluconolactonase [Paludibacter sp.]
MNTHLHVFDTPEDTAKAVAELILDNVRKKVKQSLPFNIALSGGSTPKLLFDILSNDYAESIPWHFVRLFWVDERCVPPTHIESNFGMTYEHLLKNVPIHEANIFRMQGEENPEVEAKRYQELMERELTIHDGFPRLDFVLLGMGDDGHTASIFPNDMSLLKSDAAVGVGTHPLSGQKRITLTGLTLEQASEVVFLITGPAKAGILSEIIHQKPGYVNYPASYMRSNSGMAEFYLDKEAASLL